MKAIAFILTFLVLALSSTPCCILDECGDELATEQENHEEDELCSNCSPFLSCGSCSGFVVQTYLPELSSQSAEYRTDIFQDVEFVCSEFISRIWQPPQLA